MIYYPKLMQFGDRFDKARNACVEVLYSTHVLHSGYTTQWVLGCINQLMFSEAMKLACHFVFDVYPPWTEAPSFDECPTLLSFAWKIDANRLRDKQARFACEVLGYMLTQIPAQQQCLKISWTKISGIELLSFSPPGLTAGGSAHQMLKLCSSCVFPSRNVGDWGAAKRNLCMYMVAYNQWSGQTSRHPASHEKKVGSVTLSL
ncbi:hypothetical protein SKAU_G00426440 [Synaphobranchus kaupii]|uniref:Uncharacterized protein n=1 Tax=Synaphobranchus kaupii TaxID=118154 RepID=A0A9Q1E577_SYNKA|nr:hypothetical protein SKAU_G00426440 [Synaphobranchus kaupii]